MQQIYYYGKFIVITTAVVGLLYLWFKYEASLPDTRSTGPKLPDKLADYTDCQAFDSLKAGTLPPINNGHTLDNITAILLTPINIEGTAPFAS